MGFISTMFKFNGNGHVSASQRGKMSNTNYASMLNGLTKPQLKTEQAALQRQLRSPLLSSSVRTEAQQKLSLVNKEIQSRPNSTLGNMFEDSSRTQNQKAVASQPTSALQSELAQLYQQRDTEKNLAAQAKAMGMGVSSQFDSNYDKDSPMEKRIGALEAELTKRGQPLKNSLFSSIGNAIKTPIKVISAFDGHIPSSTRGKMSNTDYASMCNGLTTAQLQKEQTALQHQLVQGSFFGRTEAQQKLELVNKELQSRPNGWLSVIIDNRTQLQNQYANKPNAELRLELQGLYQQRDAEKNLTATLRGMGLGVSSQFDSNYDTDSITEKRIGALEAELSKRGLALPK